MHSMHGFFIVCPRLLFKLIEGEHYEPMPKLLALTRRYLDKTAIKCMIYKNCFIDSALNRNYY